MNYSMSNMVTTNSTALAKIANSPGRIQHEFNADPKSVVMKVNDALHKAALVMGLNADAKTLAITASEAVKKIMDVYPHAPVDDVTLAVSMASYGEIRLENQLTTISALNVYQWYKQFRYDHSHRSTLPPPKPITGFQEPTAEEKARIVRDGFVKFVSNPTFHDLTLDFQFKKLIDIGAFEPSIEERRSYYFREAFRQTQAPPIEFLKDRVKRKDVYAFQDLFSKHGENLIFTDELKDNVMHKLIADNAKRQMVIDFMSMADKDELINLYDEKYGKKMD
jgi:hypothetical protein